MEHADRWDLTDPSSFFLPSQTIFSYGAVSPAKDLSSMNEYKSKRNRHRMFNENGRYNGRICPKPERSELVPLSSTCRISNRNNLRRSFKPDKQFAFVTRKNEEELKGRVDHTINREDTHIWRPRNKNVNNESSGPFVEVRAIYKILDFITDSDPTISWLTNNCCNEISRTLQCLLAHRNKKLEDLLLSDPSLRKCERCGVISYSLRSRPIIEDIKGTKVNSRAKLMTAERDSIASEKQNNEESHNLIGSPDWQKADGRFTEVPVDGFKINQRAKYVDKLNGVGSSPIRECALATESSSRNGANNISETEINAAIQLKDRSHLDNNTIKKLFTMKNAKINKRYRCDGVVRNDYLYNGESAMKANADTDKEEIVRKISYERKSQIDELMAADPRAKIVRRQKDLLKTDDNNYPIGDVAKYLAHRFTTVSDAKGNESFWKLLEGKHRVHVDNARTRRGSILHDSRGDRPQHESGFWLFNKSGNLPELILDECRNMPISRLGNISDDFCTKISRRSDSMESSSKTDGCIKCVEKDSLENCSLLEQGKESDTTFSSSSAENLIHEWMGRLEPKMNDVDGDISRGRRLVSSRPLLDIARYARRGAVNDRRFDDAETSILKQPHKSNIFTLLSPKARSKIYHLIQRIVLSDSAKDSKAHREKHLTTNVTNGEKLSYSKSADGTLMRANNAHETKVKNILLNDCIPTKLSKLADGKNGSLTKQDISGNLHSQNLAECKNDPKVSRENITGPVLPDKFEETELAHRSSRKIARRIIYKNISLKDIAGNENGHLMAGILPIYREILKSSENMDWESFRELIEQLHPDQKGFWREICEAISNEARTVSDDSNDSMVVCIEISPKVTKEAPKTSRVTAHNRDIVFELDMTLRDVDGFIRHRLQPVKERLDTPRDADEVATTN